MIGLCLPVVCMAAVTTTHKLATANVTTQSRNAVLQFAATTADAVALLKLLLLLLQCDMAF
jgi:hypothetical protein